MERLRQFPWNTEAWDRFVELYRPKIYGWCRAWGLQEADAEDVAQDVIAKLTQKMASFQYDQTRCFRAWLKTITQHALSDLMASRYRALWRRIDPDLEVYRGARGPGKTDRRAFRPRIAGPGDRTGPREGCPRDLGRFSPDDIRGILRGDASKLLGIPVASVFVAKHRVQKILKEELAKLESAEEE